MIGNVSDFGPEKTKPRHQLKFIIVPTGCLVGYIVVGLGFGAWYLAAVLLGAGVGYTFGQDRGWRAAWGVWERPYARMWCELADDMLATDDLDDDARNAFREMQEFSAERLHVTRRW